jgi:carbon monoxide dehydrogenase subunit G
VEIARLVSDVWAYVENFQNWAPFVTGFRDLKIIDDRHSVWTLRGDVGVLAREVEFESEILGWEPERKVEFSLKGVNERLEGAGTFLLEPRNGQAEAGSRLTFRLRLTPGGPMAPMVEVLMKPLIGPAAEKLGNSIRDVLQA